MKGALRYLTSELWQFCDFVFSASTGSTAGHTSFECSCKYKQRIFCQILKYKCFGLCWLHSGNASSRTNSTLGMPPATLSSIPPSLLYKNPRPIKSLYLGTADVPCSGYVYLGGLHHRYTIWYVLSTLSSLLSSLTNNTLQDVFGNWRHQRRLAPFTLNSRTSSRSNSGLPATTSRVPPGGSGSLDSVERLSGSLSKGALTLPRIVLTSSPLLPRSHVTLTSMTCSAGSP